MGDDAGSDCYTGPTKKRSLSEDVFELTVCAAGG